MPSKNKRLSSLKRQELLKIISLRRAAMHEAAHAVIGRAMGQACGLATIRPDETSAGHSICAEVADTCAAWKMAGRQRQPSSILVGRIICVMAGAEAERTLLGDATDIFSSGDKGDVRQVDAMLSNLLIENTPDHVVIFYKSRLRRWTRYLVQHHYKKITLVAKALLQHETLDGDAIEQISGQRSINTRSNRGIDDR